MPPIPKFAQVLAKRAKAKPKIISGNPVTKKIASNQTKKFAKDDMELAKVRKQEIRKKIEPFLKKSKDDSELLKVENRLNSLNLKNLKNNDVLNCVEDLKKLLNQKNSTAKKLSDVLEIPKEFSSIKPTREGFKFGLELLQNMYSELSKILKNK